MSQIKRRIPIHNILLQTLILFALLGPSICGCNDEPAKLPANDIVESDFGGVWEGSLLTDDTTTEVKLTSEPEGGEIVYTLHYGGTYASKLVAKEPILRGSKLTLSIDKTTGNLDILWPGKVILTMRDDKKSMDVTIQPEVGEAKAEEAKALSEKLKAKLTKTQPDL